MELKKTISLLAAVFAALSATASVPAALTDTLVDVKDAHRVILTENDSCLNLSITGSGRDSAYTFAYAKASSPGGVSSVVERASKWDFSFSIPMRKKKTDRYFSMGGVAFGFVTALGAPSGMKVDMASSYEIFADLARVSYLTHAQKNEYSFGIGIDWRNYRMTGRTRFLKDGSGNLTLDGYPEGTDIQFSRIKVFSLAFPFRYRYNFTGKCSVGATVILNLNTYASMKTRYSYGGRSYKEFSKDIHQTPVSFDVMAHARYRSLGVYVKYSPCDVLNSEFGPSFQSLSTGLMFFF